MKLSSWRKNLAWLAAMLIILAACASPTPAPSPPPTPTSPPALTPRPSSTPTPSVAQPDYWPTDGWRSSTPEEQGMDSAQLAKAFKFATTRRADLHSLIVIRNGYIVAEAYLHPFDGNTRHALYSVTKSFTSALVGIARADGAIADLDQAMLDYFPDYSPAEKESKQTITLQHLLTMTSGLHWPEDIAYGTTLNPVNQMSRSDDWVNFILEQPLETQPGTQFNYSSGDSHLLSAIVQQATGDTTLQLAEERLFAPLGIADYWWREDPQKIASGGFGLHLTPYDMAKFGFLYLQNGLWEREQLIPSDWVEDSPTAHIPADSGHDYGYQWWVYSDPDTFAARGSGGQWISVIPDKQLVVVTTAALSNDDANLGETLARYYIAPAVISDEALLPNAEGFSALESALARWNDPQPKPVPSLPDIASVISGKTYQLEANPAGIKTVGLEFEDDEAILHVEWANVKQQYLAGLDNVYRLTDLDEFGVVSARGKWRSDKMFEFEMQIPTDGEVWTWIITFEEDSIQVVRRPQVVGTELRIKGTLVE